MAGNPILFVYQGEWGLPSIDFDCLRALCAVKFAKVPIEIRTKGNPFLSGEGHLPYIKTGNAKIVGYEKIINYLKEQGYSLNDKLPRNVSRLAEAYECLVFNNLHPYFQYFMFGLSDNIDETRKLYALRTPFPFNFYYPGKYVKAADDVMEVFGGFSIHDKLEFQDTDTIVLNAKKCINLLSSRLDKKKWFFGDSFSTTDIQIYAYLSILNNITLPQNPLQVHLSECRNLIDFIDRITKKFFAAEGHASKEGSQKKRSGNSSVTMTPSEQEFVLSKRKTQILATLAAAIAMGAYAAWMGILKVTPDSSFNYNIDYREEDDDED